MSAAPGVPQASHKPAAPRAQAELDWQLKSRCREVNPEEFFSKTTQAAIEVCRLCVVRMDCLEYALDHEESGVWGGLTVDQRDRIRKYRLRVGAA